ncbi:hypothetical protein [Pandoraea communis]|uniref:hypothetical protein n=1 Tax=Pandoraea communis TaxID=2508297 RepID=UPI0025A57617|nr:hypothetical protein [Pandoraea communis]MDM8356577.1 hypothetical protein [Pandoraea communis]
MAHWKDIHLDTILNELAAIIGELPKDVRIVTDVGASMFSGWGDIKRLEYHSKYNALELFFN